MTITHYDEQSRAAFEALRAERDRLREALTSARTMLVAFGGDPRGSANGDEIQAAILGLIDAALAAGPREREGAMSPLVVPDVSGRRALELVRRLADVINALTRLKAAMVGASDCVHIKYFPTPEASHAAACLWNERLWMLEKLDRDFRDLALALQARSDRP